MISKNKSNNLVSFQILVKWGSYKNGFNWNWQILAWVFKFVFPLVLLIGLGLGYV